MLKQIIKNILKHLILNNKNNSYILERIYDKNSCRELFINSIKNNSSGLMLKKAKCSKLNL